MMEKHDSFFTPDRIDEQIEQGLTQAHLTSESQLLAEMQQVAQEMRAEQDLSLQRVETRLLAQHSSRSNRQRELSALSAHRHKPFYQREVHRGNRYSMQQEQKSSGIQKLGRRVSLLVAVLMTTLLIGSLVVVLNLTHQKTTTGANRVTAQATSTPALTSVPTPSSFGQTLYTTPSNTSGFDGFAWSPDSQRIAAITMGGVQIWDATTGKHLINVQLSGAVMYPYGIAWSPNSQMIAVVTNQQLLLVDGSTGKVMHTYAASIASVHPSNSSPLLSTLLPVSGGLGFRAVTWSPDGRFIAAAVSAGINGFVQIINAQDASLAYTLHVTGNYNPVNGLSWSSDGQYLAASSFNTEPGDATVVPPDQEFIIWAWKVSTRQVVFQHSGGNGIGDPLAFQPGSHSLAFFTQTKQTSTSPATPTVLVSTLETWDVATGKLAKHYQAVGLGSVVWSPDGTLLAYVGGQVGTFSQNEVTIIDASSGSPVFTYTGHHLNIAQLAWSPNGKYIVSGEGQTEGDMVAKVWTAA